MASRSPPREPSVARDGCVGVRRAGGVDDRTATLGGGGLVDVRYAVAREGIARSPSAAQRTTTVPAADGGRALARSRRRDDPAVGVIILTGEGTRAFCAGGDRAGSGGGGYDDGRAAPRLQILDFQVQMRRCPKPIVAMVAGWAVGNGHILHVVADLTIAADNAVFGQTGPRVGSFDGGYGSAHMARIIEQKRAREIWFLCRFYSADEALGWGLVNAVVPVARLERETLKWCRRMQNRHRAAVHESDAQRRRDGAAGLSELAGGDAPLGGGEEGRDASREATQPDAPAAALEAVGCSGRGSVGTAR